MQGGRMGPVVRPAVELLRVLALLLFRRRWHGQEHMPPAGEPVILVANHLSHTDPVTISQYVLNTRGRLPKFLIKHSLWSVPVVRAVVEGAHQIPVYRNSADASKSLDAAVEALANGDLVLIYPEGTTTKRADYLPGPGKTGAARLALLSGAPVLPLVHWGEQRVFGNDRRPHLFARPVSEVRLLAPLDLSPWLDRGITAEVLVEITALIMKTLTDGVRELARTDPAA